MKIFKKLVKKICICPIFILFTDHKYIDIYKFLLAFEYLHGKYSIIFAYSNIYRYIYSLFDFETTNLFRLFICQQQKMTFATHCSVHSDHSGHSGQPGHRIWTGWG